MICWLLVCRATDNMNMAANIAISNASASVAQAYASLQTQLTQIPTASRNETWYKFLETSVAPTLRQAASSSTNSSCPTSCLDLDMIASKHRYNKLDCLHD